MTNKPASFTLRLLAYGTEHAYYLLLTMIFILLSVSQPTLAKAISVFFLYLIFILLNPLIIYNSIVLTHYFGGSLGKLITGLQVTNEYGAPLTPKRIAFRQTAGYGFSWLVFGLGFASIAKDSKKQGWHDKAVGSLVVVKQDLWPVAVMVCIVSIAGSVYLGNLVWQQITSGPLKAEAQMLYQKFTQQIAAEAQKSTTVQKSTDPAETTRQMLIDDERVYKTHINAVPPYRVKYPAIWPQPTVHPGMTNFYNGYSGTQGGGFWVVIFATDVKGGSYPAAIPEFNSRYKSLPGRIETIPGKTATKIRNLQIDGVNAVEYEEIDNQTNVAAYLINYQFVKNDYVYHIEFRAISKEVLDGNKETVGIMIENFKFLN